METREINHADWSDFLDEFSREHMGTPVRIEVLGSDVGAQVEADNLPLVGISTEAKQDTIWVSVARAADDHITHGVQQATHVRVEQTEAGDVQALQIQSKSGVTTLVRLTPVR